MKKIKLKDLSKKELKHVRARMKKLMAGHVFTTIDNRVDEALSIFYDKYLYEDDVIDVNWKVVVSGGVLFAAIGEAKIESIRRFREHTDK